MPYGEKRTYGDLAAELGDPGAAQAVGNANGWNPITIVVPCHRVVGASGGLTGYAGGVDRKTLPTQPGRAARRGRRQAVLKQRNMRPFEAVVREHGATMLRACHAVVDPHLPDRLLRSKREAEQHERALPLLPPDSRCRGGSGGTQA
ncbi:methylated-DNA--[protein]-cysteine S-methyltransferase [Amycolatopsis carbonis]|uniref:methylated-DNA--[protein]-cysteine S-methyltransferase n=1 Tax=Amycolatopsis carbonis TaxID=715471 RepID=UPI003340E78E